MNGEMEQYAVPVDGRNLGWAKSAYTMNNVPIVQIVTLGNGQYAIVIMAPAGGPPPDWRSMRTYKRPPFWQRIDWGRWVPWLIVLAVVAGVGWMLVNGAPMVLAQVAPDIQLPTIEIPGVAMPDVGGAIDKAMQPVNEAMSMATRAIMGLFAFAVGLVVLWLLWTFRGTIGGISRGAAGMMRRGK